MQITTTTKTWPKRCACGLAYTKKQWELLPYRGIQSGMDGARRYYPDCEMRDCHCGSTLCLKLPADDVHYEGGGQYENSDGLVQMVEQSKQPGRQNN